MNVVVRFDDRFAAYGGSMESCIPRGEKLVPQPDGLRDDTGVWLACQIWFSAPRIDMCVRTEEGVEDPGLIPTRQELFRRVAKEAADVGARKGEACDIVGKDHGNRSRKV